VSLGTFTKQPAEKFVIAFSFADELGDDEAIVINSSTVTAMDNTGVDVTADVLESITKVLADTAIKIQVKAGTVEKAPYKLTARAVTDTSPANLFELDIIMKIKEL